MNNTKDNEMTLIFKSKSANESFARATVGAFASQLDPTLDELADIKTAVSEAVTNAIIHGYNNTTGDVHIHCEIKDRTIYIEISDKGCGIKNLAQAMQPLYSGCPEMERSGMGFTVMETFMDCLDVSSTLDKGTTVRMSKTLRA